MSDPGKIHKTAQNLSTTFLPVNSKRFIYYLFFASWIIYQQLFCSVVSRFDACARMSELHVKTTYLASLPFKLTFMLRSTNNPHFKCLMSSSYANLFVQSCASMRVFSFTVQTAVCQFLMQTIADSKEQLKKLPETFYERIKAPSFTLCDLAQS